MSNPFAAFRKNQKVWMAGLVLLAILAFIVAPAIDTATSAMRGGGADTATVVRWDGGKITVADLQNSAQKHSSLVRFLGALAREVVEAGGQPQVPGFAVDRQTNQILGLGIQTSSNEVDVCRTRILVTQGRKMGIEFGDDAIDSFIASFCDGKISTSRVEELLKETTNGRLSWFEVREMLKDELCAMVVGQIARTGMATQPPGKTYRDFRKLTQTAKVDAFPIFVDDYLDKVSGNPTEAEIQAIYTAGMNRPANPNSPEPGFARRYQANVQYVEAKLQTWIDREKAKLTEEQLKTEYEKRVELGQLKVPVVEETPAEVSAEVTGDDMPAEGAAENQPPAAEPPAPESTTPESPTAPTSSPETAAEPSPPATPATETPAAETNAAEKPKKEDQAANGNSRTTRLVAFVQEETPPAGQASTPPPVEQPPQLNQSIPDKPSATAEPAIPEPAITDSPDSSPAVPSEQVVQPSADMGAETAAVDEGPQMRTQTFEEARDTIADSLARDAAIPAMTAALNELFAEVMTPYFQAYQRHAAFMEQGLVKDEDGELRRPPVKPDLKKLAEERGFVFSETGLVDGVKIAQTPFGLGNIVADPNQPALRGSVANIAMNPILDLYRPMQSNYFDQAALMEGKVPEFLQYLFWKTEERQAYAPELSEVREEVVDVWKRQKARQLADAAAIELSKKVGGEADPWGTALNTAEKALIVETDPFPWMTRFGEFTMTSNVAKLDAVGAEFMQKVFSTPVGQVGVAPNASHNIYYVVRVAEFAPTDEELQDRFNADPIKSGPMGLAREESDGLLVDWYENLEQELGVEWQMNIGQYN